MKKKNPIHACCVFLRRGHSYPRHLRRHLLRTSTSYFPQSQQEDAASKVYPSSSRVVWEHSKPSRRPGQPGGRYCHPMFCALCTINSTISRPNSDDGFQTSSNSHQVGAANSLRDMACRQRWKETLSSKASSGISSAKIYRCTSTSGPSTS
jgi:hypothetical protein